MDALIADWYGILNTFNRLLNEPIRSLAFAGGLPPLTALLLGVLGAASPCQLTTGLGAIALIGRRLEPGTIPAALAYVGGKAVTYAVLGLLFVLLGQAISQGSIPVIQVVRRALGPLMLLAGLALAGVFTPRLGLGIGERLATFAADRLDASRPRGAFALGMAFGLAFCPTLFLLFFGLLIPLALTSPAGIAYPAIFALGTALPVLTILTLLGLGVRAAADARGWIGRARPAVTRVAGLVLILTGLNDTIVYWLL
ncbi:MAG: sulfite exporter TauE/SafE family protein [Thermoleophilaceae bacterium]